MPHRRLTHPARGIVLAVCSSVIVLSACTPPLPPDVKAALAESQVTCETGVQSANVPPGFTGVMDAVGLALSSVCPEQSIVETPAEPASLAVTAQLPTDAQVAEVQAMCPSSAVVVAPAFSYGIAMAVNLIGLEGLVLTPPAMAGLLDGSVTAWDDPRIVDANDGFDLSGLPPVTLVSTDTGSASMSAMTSWLSSVGAWQSPSATTDAGEHVADEQALLDALLSVDGAVAVLPAFLAVTNGISVASTVVDGTVLAPDDGSVLKIGAGASAVVQESADALVIGPGLGGVPSPETFDAAAAKLVLADGQPLVGWPVMETAHLVVCDEPLPIASAQYVVRLAGQGSLETFGVTPLPEPIRVRAFTPLRVTVSLPEQ